MCAISTPLAQGRESLGKAPNRDKIGLGGRQFPVPCLLSFRFPFLPAKGTMVSVAGAGIAASAAGTQYVRCAMFSATRRAFVPQAQQYLR